MMAWADSEPTQHLALYSWANVFAGTDYGIFMLTSYIYSVAGSDNQSNKNLGDGIWHG